MLAQLLHAAVELHERPPQALDLLLGQPAAVDPAQRLALHQLPQQLDDRQHELGEALLDRLRVGVDAAAERVRRVRELARERVEVAVERPGEHLVAVIAGASANEYGGHGPVQRMLELRVLVLERAHGGDEAVDLRRGRRGRRRAAARALVARVLARGGGEPLVDRLRRARGPASPAATARTDTSTAPRTRSSAAASSPARGATAAAAAASSSTRVP